jgi:predicted dehydrogenase
LRYITGLEATRVSAELSTLVPGRTVFDNATMRLTLSNGVPATVWATMAATGHKHGLHIRIFGHDASPEWRATRILNTSSCATRTAAQPFSLQA